MHWIDVIAYLLFLLCFVIILDVFWHDAYMYVFCFYMHNIIISDTCVLLHTIINILMLCFQTLIMCGVLHIFSFHELKFEALIHAQQFRSVLCSLIFIEL